MSLFKQPSCKPQQGLDKFSMSKRVLEQLLSTLQEAVLITDEQGRTEYVNETFTYLTGYSLEEMVGCNPRVLRSGLHTKEFYQGMWQDLQAVGYWQGEIWNRRKTGEVYPSHLTLRAITDELEKTIYLGVFHDISDHKKLEERLHQQRHYDELTGLMNRATFHTCLRNLINESQNPRCLTLICLDIDRFQNVNDSLGQAGGDDVLRHVSLRLQKVAYNSVLLGRLSGDGFGVVVRMSNREEMARTVESILAQIAQPISINNRQFVVTCSIGIAEYSNNRCDVDSFLINADTALYEAKRVGGNSYSFYEPVMLQTAVMKMEAQSHLHHALAQNELVLHYQPQFQLETGLCTGFEALVRWNHPQRGLVLPGDFIPLAEETGLITQIGTWVLHSACLQLSRWADKGLPAVRVAVNLSAQQFGQEHLVDLVEEVLTEYNIHPTWLELEITESVAMENVDYTVQQLKRLRDLGVQATIDDFGTGHSSLGYLRRLPISRLKIDRSFVQDITTSQDDATITRAIVTLAHALRLKVVAEGVETEGQSQQLGSYGCDEVQGFFFSRPKPPDEVEKWLASTLNL